jgi:glycosyltransferase involved in cell wall biosynthesis
MDASPVDAARPLRIGINVSWMAPGQTGGMEWYVRNLLRELGALDQRHEWTVVTSPANWHLFELPARRWRKIAYAGEDHEPFSYVVRMPAAPPTLRDRARRLLRWLRRPAMRRAYGRLNDLIGRERLDLWFCPLMYALPIDVDIPVVNTIPDLQHEHFAEFFGGRELAFRTLGYRSSCLRAATTIGISRFVAEDLRARYGIERAVDIPLALDPAYAVDHETTQRLVDRVRLKYRIDEPFLFYPANGWPHKDHETLVGAFRLVREKRRDLRLLLTGCPFDVMDRLRPMFATREEADAVRHLGYVDREDLIGLYAAATAMVFPSRFEGFGLPLLEAMSAGTPIVCSQAGSIPEVAGEAALYVDPDDAAALAAGVLRLLDDDVLRTRLVAAGYQRVQAFSFTETARRTLAVFDEVLDGSRRAAPLPPFRPLIPHQWLQDGHSRWYFHCADLREMRLCVVQPTELPELADQRVTVRLNERAVAEAAVEPRRERALTVRVPADGTDFHRLDVEAAVTTRHKGEILSLQVRSLTLVDGRGREIRLIE